MKGQLLVLDEVDVHGRKFAKDCKIIFSEKIPVFLEFNHSDPNSVIGYSEITRDDKGLVCEVNLNMNSMTEDQYYVGGFYTNLEHHKEGSIDVIDKCTLRAMSIVQKPAHKSLKIMRDLKDGGSKYEYQ